MCELLLAVMAKNTTTAVTILRSVHQIQPGDLVTIVSGNRAGFRIAEVQHGQNDSGLAGYRLGLVGSARLTTPATP